ncbi:MAG: hypothetical protein JJ863_21270 [Deltaproteobacteria bacterium]|nr:hypothetical protein [Deltaproteobacteria bacterium]
MPLPELEPLEDVCAHCGKAFAAGDGFVIIDRPKRVHGDCRRPYLERIVTRRDVKTG